MVHTILDNTNAILNMEATTENGGTWTTFGSAASLALDTDIFKVGAGSIAAKLDGGTGGAQGGMQITTTGTTYDFDDAGTDRGMVSVWVNFTGIIGANGIRLRVGSDASNYKWFQLATADGANDTVKYEGGWTKLTASMNSGTNVGTPTMSACDYFAVEFDTDLDIMGNIKTIWIDQLIILTAAQIASGTRALEIRGTTDTAGSAIDEISALPAVVDMGAVVKSANGSYNLNMPIKFGNTVAATNSTITSTNEYLFIPSHDWEAGFCVIEFDGGTGTNTATWGAESGTGDNTLGATGGAFIGTGGNFSIDCSNADSTNVFAGVIIDGCNSLLLTSTNTKFVSCTYVNSGLMTIDNGGEFRDGTITDSTTASPVGAVLLVANPVTPEFRDNLVQNCDVGIENERNGPADLDLRNIKYANNTTSDLRHNGTGVLTVNVLENGDTPTTSNGGGGSVTIVNAKILTVTVKDTNNVAVEGARVRIEEDNGTLITQGNTNASGVYSISNYSYTSDQAINVIVRLKGYQNFRGTGTITTNGFSQNVRFIKDDIVNLP